MGYDPVLHEFDVTLRRARVALTSSSRDLPESPRGLPFWDSPDATATGRLVHVGLAYEEDIPVDGLEGAIALIERGETSFREKVSRSVEAGAIGAIVYNNLEGPFYHWSAVNPSVPVMSISHADGLDLVDLVKQGDVGATISIGMEDLSSQNIIAIAPSATSTDRTVVIGGHYDTVISTEGASDNASGVAAILAMAEQIRGHSYSFDVRIILFGAEEDGLHGSIHYVDTLTSDEISNIVAMLNFDAFGIGTSLMYMSENHLTLEARKFAIERYGMEMSRFNEDPWSAYGGAGDHAPFRRAGIPTMSLISDDIEHINSPADEMHLINPELLGRATEIGLHMLEWLSEENR